MILTLIFLRDLNGFKLEIGLKETSEEREKIINVLEVFTVRKVIIFDLCIVWYYIGTGK